jgi:hypothetical protein
MRTLPGFARGTMPQFRVGIWFALALVLSCVPQLRAQPTDRTLVAQGEYRVRMEGDVGAGPIQTQVYHLSETWSLWRTAAGYDLDGYKTYEFPRGNLHHDRFTAKLSPDLQLVSIKDFAPLVFRPDSGPLSCELRPRLLRCDSGGKDLQQRVSVQLAVDRPYGLVWPLSAFCIASFTRAASTEGEVVAVQIVQLEEISKRLPVLAVRSNGHVRYLGTSEAMLAVSGKSWHPNVYRLTVPHAGEITIWTSQEGLLLAAQLPDWPKASIELVKYAQFADF